MDDGLLAILRCPDDRSAVQLASDQTVAKLNAAIRSGQVRNAGGQQLTDPIGGGLVRAAGDLLYPIVERIPVMLSDEAIPLRQLEVG